MKFNNKIIKVLNTHGVNIEDFLGYLVNIYYNVSPSYLPTSIAEESHSMGILSHSDEGIIWNIELFENETEGAWVWVESEYVELFKDAGKNKHKKEAVLRMKKFFSQNPDVRKEEVLGATNLYLLNTAIKFVRLPHYFIFKGTGSEKVSDLMNWIETYRNITKSNEDGRDISRRLQ